MAVRAAVDEVEIDPQYANGNYPRWDSIYRQLTEKFKTPSIPPTQAMELIASGQAVLVDCRLPEDFDKSHPEVRAPAWSARRRAATQHCMPA